MLRSLKKLSVRLIAAGLNDRRPQIPYSYGWLNNLCWQLVSRGSAAELRPAYAWGVIQGAALGKALGYERVSVIEFGVAGGRGLVSLESIAQQVSDRFGIGIDVYGFDTGEGLPAVSDLRDLPNLYSGGHYRMNPQELRARLRDARLILGPIKDTIGEFINSPHSPIAFASIDVDLYSSTIDSLRALEGDSSGLLPRVQIYLDDIIGLTFGDHNGERAAVNDFNAANEQRKISPIYGLRFHLPFPLKNMTWSEQMFMAHIFDHPRYANNDGLIGVTHAPLGAPLQG
jgi:hypothetical protein